MCPDRGKIPRSSASGTSRAMMCLLPNEEIPMKIAALQMVSTARVDDNLETARRLVGFAVRDGAELVVLPEYFCLMGRADRDKLAVAEAPGAGPIQRMLAEAARDHGVWVIGGTLPITSPGPDRVFNANCVYA